MPAAQQYNNITSRQVIGYIFEDIDQAAKASWVDLIAAREPSNQSIETYAGLGNAPMLREWIGGRQKKTSTEKTLTITNKDWESSIGIPSKDMRRDKSGQIRRNVNQLAVRAIQHQEKLLSILIAAGAASTYGNAYTGSTFFNTSHTYATGVTNNNSISVDISALPVGDTTGAHGSTTAPSTGEMALCILQAVQQLFGMVDSENEPLNTGLTDFVIMVPVSLWAVAQAAITSGQLAQGMTNPLVGGGKLYNGRGLTFSVVPNPRLSAFTTKFVVFGANSMVKPFILQTETEPSVNALAEGSEYETLNKEHLYTVDWSGNVGYFAPDKAVLVTMT